MKKSEAFNIESEIKSLESALIRINNEIKESPNNKKLEIIKTSYDKNLEILKSMNIAYTNKQWSNYLKCKIDLDKELLKDIKKGNTISGKSEEEIKKDIEVNGILLEKNIEPIYDTVSMQGYNFIKLVLGSALTLIIIIVAIILSADIISSEFESNTYKLLFTQPISKNSILFSKTISITIIVNVIIFSMLALLFFILGVKNGFGDLNYPTQFFINGEIGYIEIGRYIGVGLLSLLTLITFTCALSIFSSIVCSNTSSSISIAIIIVVSLYMIINHGFINSIAHLIPFTYIDISNVLQGNIAIAFKNSGVNPHNAIMNLCISAIIILGLSIFTFERKLEVQNKLKK
ncbi:ABC transporter permease subunit [Hathewaya histolytica]|uniref:ABC transporter permease n=2 Tax=Hathewaya histolytica TaxID=1498 RepID=A0A4U9QWW4_HATHI|nr:ABC transporter permease [Hathewaya histolytica]